MERLNKPPDGVKDRLDRLAQRFAFPLGLLIGALPYAAAYLIG